MPHKRECHPLMNVNDLDFRITYQLCQNFDIDRSWELLAGEIGYSTKQIQTFEMEIQRARGSPTKSLLWDWGSRGATVKDLYNKLALINKVQGMRLLEHIVKPPEKKEEAKSDYSLTSGSSMESKTDNLSSRAFLCDEDSLPIPSMKKQGHMMKESNMPNENLDMSVNKPRMNDKVLGMILDPHLDGAASGEIYNQKEHLVALKGEGAASSAPRSLEHVQSMIDEHRGDIAFSMQLSDEEKDVAYALMNTKSYSYKELSAATDGFCASNKLGEGKFGAVYYGIVKNTKCAIKRLLQSKPAGVECSPLQEASKLKALSKYRHEHIVNLYGYAIDNDSIFYIYEYMANRSLHYNLHAQGNVVLSWEQRLSILRGAACGLQFLHTVESVPIIHGNIKSGNILLDRHFEAKIGDLGLAKEATGGDTPGQKTHITKQTTCVLDYKNKAYHPPEIARGNGFSVKGDSYSFGVVIFECLTGQEAYDERREGNIEEKFLVEYIQTAVHDEPKLDKRKTFQDPKLTANFPIPTFDSLFEVATKCTSEKKKDRPTMVEVYKQLEEWERDCEGPYYKNLPGPIEKKIKTHDNGSIREHRLTDVGHPSEGPDLKAPPTSKSPSKVPESPIDMLPKDQPMPIAFKLQREIDLRNEQKSMEAHYANVESISEQIRKTYVSDPKKLSEMEKYDQKFSVGPLEKKVAQFVAGEPLQNTEEFTQPVAKDIVYEKAKDIVDFQETEWPENSKPAQDYENLQVNEDIPSPYDIIGAHQKVEHDEEEINFEQELSEIAGKASKNNGSMNEIFERFHNFIQDENLTNVQQEDDFNILFDFETESEDSTITESINDPDALTSADFDEEDLFASEKHSYVNLPEENQSCLNVQDKVSNANITASLEEHERKLAKYQGMVREDSDELFERSAQPNDIDDGCQGESLPVQGDCEENGCSQQTQTCLSLPIASQNRVQFENNQQGGSLQWQEHKQAACNDEKGVQQRISKSGQHMNIQDFLQRREPSEGHCEEYV